MSDKFKVPIGGNADEGGEPSHKDKKAPSLVCAKGETGLHALTFDELKKAACANMMEAFRVGIYTEVVENKKAN